MKITVDTDLCCGAGQCAVIAPTVFDQDDDGIVILLEATPSESLRAEVTEAVAACPAVAIALLPEGAPAPA